MPAKHTTTIGRKWLIKMTVFLVGALGLGAWGLYDAAVAYPRRGAQAAERLEFLYLDALTQRGTRTAIVSFEPEAEFRRLRAAKASLSPEERARFDWLEQLKIIGRLNEQHTRIPDAVARHKQLAARWLVGGNTPTAPPLAWHDIKVQWAIAALGFGLALWLLVHVARVARRRYGWDPEEKRLYLPGGASLVPADVAEFDKRKWDKFLIYLKIKPHHERHGGRELTLDLYHHTPLEDWVLEMERIAFPENSRPPSHGGTPAEDAAGAPRAQPVVAGGPGAPGATA